jgi:TrmH family RNA methyltransferase
MAERLTSVANPLVRELLRLHDARERRDLGRFLVEGRRAIAAFLEAGWRPEELLLRDGEEAPPGWPMARQIGPAVATRLSQAASASGYLAVFAIPPASSLDPGQGGLVLAEVGDPGNLGTLVRCAAAFAQRQVVLVGGADPWSHKVVQASAGALAGLSLHRLDPAAGLAPLAGGAPRCALVVDGGSPPEALRRGPRWLVVGSEAHGIRPEWSAACEERLTLPMPGGTESLNAAMAGAIACWELFRPRG